MRTISPMFPAWFKWSIPAILPPLFLANVIRTLGVNVVYLDEWEMIPTMQKVMSGSLSFSDLFAQQNDHRILFAKIATIPIALFTGYNTIAEMVFSWIFICFTALLLFRAFQHGFSLTSSPRLAIVFVPVTLLLFDLCQYESILWGFQMGEYMMLFSAVATIYLLDKSRSFDFRFALSLLSAIVSSLSFFVVGLVIWPVAFLQVSSSVGERKLVRQGIICVAAAVTFMCYFYGYRTVSYFGNVFSAPLTVVIYFFALIGTPFSNTIFPSSDTTVAVVFGVAITAFALYLFVLILRNRSLLRNDASLWFWIVIFIGLCSLGNALVRSDWTVANAQASRYTPMTVLGIAGLYLLALSVWKVSQGRNRRFLVHALLVIIILGFAISSTAVWQGSHSFGDSRKMSAYVLETYHIQSDQNIENYLYPSPNILRERAQFLEVRNWSVFANKVANPSSLTYIGYDPLSSLDTINGVNVEWTSNGTRSVPIIIHPGQQETITITGWAVDNRTDVASVVWITVDGKIQIPTLYGLDRPDIANNLDNPNLRYSGFIASFSSSIFSLGNHTIYLTIVTSGEQYVYQSTETVDLSIE
ncbi:MAG: hypothetical protein ACLP9D_14985 [Candidatus Bathyarchaeia archaeon]